MAIPISLLIVAALSLDPSAPAPEQGPSDMVRQAIAALSPEHAKSDVEKLAAFGTRHSLSDREPKDRGYLAAANWVKAQIDALAPNSGGRLTCELETFDVPPSTRIPKGATLTNVVARLRGVDPAAADRVVYLSAHLDSRNADPMDAAADAPGANDDASGCAVLLESARVLSTVPLRSSVVFLFTAGEEQGLIGAKQHADNAAGAHEHILAVLNNDIVGDPVDQHSGAKLVRVFSEGTARNPGAEESAAVRSNAAESDSPSRELARFIDEVAAMYDLPVRPKLVFRPDRFLRGGDHLPFNDAGFPAVRFTTLKETFDRQHANVTTRDAKPYGDVPAFVDPAYTVGVARINALAAMHLAMAPAAPARVRIVTAKLDNQTTLRWDKGEDALGYEIVYRDTTSPTWQHVIDVGSATEKTLDITKDDNFFGVRAYSAPAWRSVAVFARAAKE